MRNNEYNLNNTYFINFLFLILVLSLVFSSTALGKDLDSDSSWYAILKIGKKEKLYTEGDIFYSDTDTTKCFRIQDIKEDSLTLKDVNSKDIFVVKLGQVIPLEGTKKIFVETVKQDFVRYKIQ